MVGVGLCCEINYDSTVHDTIIVNSIISMRRGSEND